MDPRPMTDRHKAAIEAVDDIIDSYIYTSSLNAREIVNTVLDHISDDRGDDEAGDDGLCPHGFPPEFCGNCHEEDAAKGGLGQ